jgi:cytochrome bd-type quinol oxidase subunit 2
LAWVGSALIVLGVVAFTLARLTSPLYDADSDDSSQRARSTSNGCLRMVVTGFGFVGAMVTCSIAADESIYRWHPLWILGIMVIVLPIVTYLKSAR